MEINLTSKLRIVFQSDADRKSAFDTLIAYRDACNTSHNTYFTMILS